MKRTLIILFLTTTILSINVYAISNKNTNTKKISNNTLKQEVIPTVGNNETLSQLHITITIPSDYKERIITISPPIFDSIKEYKQLLPGDRIKINLKIKNNSNYNYNYISDSFLISTIDPTLFGIKDNFIDTTAIGFDNKVIYDITTPYRTANEAIFSLYNCTEEDKIKPEQLQDVALSEKLKYIGYSGIEDLDKYYLDFYNSKYNLKVEQLNSFTDSTIKEIYSGKTFQIKETNPTIIQLAYNFYYNKLLSYNFKDEIVTDYNSQDFSIASYMMKNEDNKYIKKAFSIIKSKTYNQLNNMYLTLNKTYTTSSFENYNYYVSFEFKLRREETKKT